MAQQNGPGRLQQRAQSRLKPARCFLQSDGCLRGDLQAVPDEAIAAHMMLRSVARQRSRLAESRKGLAARTAWVSSDD